MLGTYEDVIERIHRKTLDENKQLFIIGTKILSKGLFSDGISCEVFLSNKYFS